MDLNLYVFDNEITPLGVIDVVTGLTWEEKFADAGNFELWCPLNESNAALLKEDNIVWIGKDSAGIIEFKELAADENNTMTIHIQGRLAEAYLDYRTVYPRLEVTDKVGSVLRLLVYDTLIGPLDSSRKIPTLALAENQEPYGDSISYQQLGDTVLSEVSRLCEANSLGFRLKFYPYEQRFDFCVCRGTDHTVNQAENTPVLFSSDLEDILTSSYSHNKSDFRNVAYISGEGEGENRKTQQVGTAEGIFRRELYVDARDLQSEKEDGSSIPDLEYAAMLTERAKTTLEDYKDIETFSATIKTFGSMGYTYGTDFVLGDKVTVYDSRLKVQTDAIVTAVVYTYDEDGERIDLTFGYEQPTISAKLRRRT